MTFHELRKSHSQIYLFSHPQRFDMKTQLTMRDDGQWFFRHRMMANYSIFIRGRTVRPSSWSRWTECPKRPPLSMLLSCRVVWKPCARPPSRLEPIGWIPYARYT
jgi:hypothetical protein